MRLQNRDKHVLVIGGGVAGLSAALELAHVNYTVTLVEESASLGGYAARFSCKATDRCVKCGACLLEQKLYQISQHPGIEIILENRIQTIRKHSIFSVEIVSAAPGEPAKKSRSLNADAIVVATGFQHCNPEWKPYGYRRFEDVITNLELEQMIRTEGAVKRPSDGALPDRIAFIQCVGSRDAKLKHLWCSKVCCGSALRTAHRIGWQRPDTEITVFYIDIQSFGKDFDAFYRKIRETIRMVRTIPGDILLNEKNRLEITYFDGESIEEEFDLVVLSIGMMPQHRNFDLLKQLGMSVSEETYLSQYENVSLPLMDGVFPAGAVLAPMSIADAVASAQKAAQEVVSYLTRQAPMPAEGSGG